jgi:hypothetical protein
LRGQRIRRLIGEIACALAFKGETRPQGHHGSGFLGCAASAGRVNGDCCSSEG